LPTRRRTSGAASRPWYADRTRDVIICYRINGRKRTTFGAWQGVLESTVASRIGLPTRTWVASAPLAFEYEERPNP